MLDCYEYWLFSQGEPYRAIDSDCPELDPESTSHEQECGTLDLEERRKKYEASLRERVAEDLEGRKTAAINKE